MTRLIQRTPTTQVPAAQIATQLRQKLTLARRPKQAHRQGRIDGFSSPGERMPSELGADLERVAKAAGAGADDGTLWLTPSALSAELDSLRH